MFYLSDMHSQPFVAMFNQVGNLPWYKKIFFPEQLSRSLYSGRGAGEGNAFIRNPEKLRHEVYIPGKDYITNHQAFYIYKAFTENTWFWQRWIFNSLYEFANTTFFKTMTLLQHIRTLEEESEKAVFNLVVMQPEPGFLEEVQNLLVDSQARLKNADHDLPDILEVLQEAFENKKAVAPENFPAPYYYEEEEECYSNIKFPSFPTLSQIKAKVDTSETLEQEIFCRAHERHSFDEISNLFRRIQEITAPGNKQYELLGELRSKALEALKKLINETQLDKRIDILTSARADGIFSAHRSNSFLASLGRTNAQIMIDKMIADTQKHLDEEMASEVITIP